MIADLKPYAEYKESGSKWLGTIPVHWSVLPNRAIFSEVKDRNHPDEEMLSVTITKGIIQQKALLAGSSKKDSSNLNKLAYKLVCPRDLAYNKMRAWQGAIGVSDFCGIVSPAYVVMRLRKDHNPRYFHHLYRTSHFAKEAERWSYGITSDMWSLRPEHFKMIYTPLPPSDEQAAIVRFLDYVNHRIERTIRAKRKVIALLKEQLEVLALGTKSNGSISGNSAWIDLFPKHWEFQKAKKIFAESIIKNNVDKELLAVTQDQGVIPKRLCSQNYVSPSGSVAGLKLVKGDDFVISLRSFQGGIEYSKYEGIVSPAYNIFSLCNDLKTVELTYFYRVIFKSKNFIFLLNTIISGIRDGKNISFSDFSELELPIPPEDELKELVLVFNKFESVRNSFDKERRVIEEYRNRLIADVVTGKLDVREAAKKLPNEAAESGIIDEDEILSGDEEMEESPEMEREEA